MKGAACRAKFTVRCLSVPCVECSATVGEPCNAEHFGDWIGFDNEATFHLARAVKGGAVIPTNEEEAP